MKPRRPLRAITNANRACWGKPPLPEPVDGYEPEPRPEGWEVVARWFASATSAQPSRPRRPRVPSDEHVDRIARLVREHRLRGQQPSDPDRELAVERTHRLQRAAHVMAEALHGVLKLAELPTNDLSMTRLVDLWNALQLASPYIGPPNKQGPQIQPWQVVALELKEPVREALMSAGHKRASIKPESCSSGSSERRCW